LKSSLECFPCFLQQALRAADRFAPSAAVKERIVMSVLKQLQAFDRNRTSPEMGAFINRTAREAVGVADLYAAEKRHSNRRVTAMLPKLQEIIVASPNPFETAVKAAIAGNLIDFTAPGGDVTTPLETLFEKAMAKPLMQLSGDAVSRLQTAAKSARNILYLMDNAGEIAADRLLIEMLPRGRVTAVVRGGPIANDALKEDALSVGIDEVAEIIDSGLALPGTLLHQCSDSFRSRFDEADVVISKGQGNFETLDFIPGKLFFLFVTKCVTVANYIGCDMGELIVSDRLK
jgi:uncharacterized protein with ATP-grasp and redox domains